MFARNRKRTPKSRTKLILLELGLKARLDQRIERVKFLFPQNSTPNRVELRCSRLGNHINDSTMTPPNDASSLCETAL